MTTFAIVLVSAMGGATIGVLLMACVAMAKDRGAEQ
jgi:hypothetical protein